MKEKLLKLDAALSSIYTREQDTITMANCRVFLKQIIDELEEEGVEDGNKEIQQKETRK